MNGNLLEILAREKAGMPAEWRAFRFECFPKTQETLYYEIEGAVAPLKSKGASKGSPNWPKLDAATRRTVVLLVQEAEQRAAEWRERTGICVRCVGKGQLLKSYSRKDGSTFKPCPVCDGTGKAALAGK